MWLRTLFDLVKPGASRHRSAVCRLSIESLADRRVPASLSVGDAAVVEGNAGTHYAVVSVNLDAPGNRTVTVNYTTANGTSKAGRDYKFASGRLSFLPGETSKSILVPVNGDRLGEVNENFFVKLSGPLRLPVGPFA